MENKSKPDLASVLKSLESDVCGTILSVRKEPQRKTFGEELETFSPDYSIYVGERHAADIYDLSETSQTGRENRIKKACEDANKDEEPPCYLFFHSNNEWRGIYIRFNEVEYKQPTLTNFNFENLPYIHYLDHLWPLAVEEMIERIKNCDSFFVKKNAICDFQKKVKEWIDSNSDSKQQFGDRVLKIIEEWMQKDFGSSITLNKIQFMLNKEFEDKLFLSILGQCQDEKLYKYSTLNTLSYILKEDGTHSMSSIACMNDNTECDYADNFVHGISTKKSNDKEDNDAQSSIMLNYDNFITSLSRIPPQKLLMWRLYGDNGKGIALQYDVKNVKLPSDFYLAPVSYPKEDGSHLELEFIKFLMSESFFGLCLRLRRWNIWQRFFKPLDYKEEQEVRLLYSPQSGLVKTKWNILNGIYSPIAIFSVKDNKASTNGKYPLPINKIFLGPRFTEQETNKTLIKRHIDELKLNIDVDTTGIHHYRVNGEK